MYAKLAPVKWKILECIFKDGFKFERQEGDHRSFAKREVLRPVVIPTCREVDVMIIRSKPWFLLSWIPVPLNSGITGKQKNLELCALCDSAVSQKSQNCSTSLRHFKFGLHEDYVI